MKIPLSSPWINDDDRAAVMAVLDTPELALGPVLTEFENYCAKLAGVKYAVAMSSGTAALSTLNRSLGWKEGDEVLTPSFSFVASANSILHVGAKPCFVDVDPSTWNMCPKDSAHKINECTRAIQMVDIFGLPANVEDLEALCKKNKLDLVEDACEAVGATHDDGRRAGACGRAGVWAFYPNKQVTSGEGGVLLTNEEDLADDCRSKMNQGRDHTAAWFGHRQLGWNHRMSDINAALGLSQLKRLDEILYKRRQVAECYAERLKDVAEIELMPDKKRSWFVYVIKLREASQREALMNHLKEQGIACSNYFVSIHLMPFIQELCGTKKGQLPHTETLSDSTVALPFFAQLSEAQVEAVTTAIKNSSANMDAYQKEQLSNWVSDFAHSETATTQPKDVRDAGPFLLQELVQAAATRCGDVQELEEKILGEELMALVQRYTLGDKVLKQLPDYLALFFEDLQTQGRFAQGDSFGRYLRTFGGRLGVRTVKRPGAKISRNDPCPCGSGKKFKKCCQGQ